MISPDKVITDLLDPFDDGTTPPARKRRGASAPRSGKTGKKYTTDAAKEFARNQGWKIVDSEEYNAHTKRHRDCVLMSDVLCLRLNKSGRVDVVLIQSAGKDEEKIHRDKCEIASQQFARFLHVKPQECDLALVCQKLGWSFLYLEWTKLGNGHKKMVKQTWWAGGDA